MDTVSMAVGVLGLALATISLGWQVMTHKLTGGRVELWAKVGWIEHDANGGEFGPFVSEYDPASDPLFSELSGPGREVVALEVRNVGRLPVTVARFQVHILRRHIVDFGLEPRKDELVGPQLPYRLEHGASATWAMDIFGQLALREYYESTRPQKRRQKRGRRQGVGVVELADGRKCRSRRIRV